MATQSLPTNLVTEVNSIWNDMLNPSPEATPKQPFTIVRNSRKITLKRFSQKFLWDNRIQVAFDASEEFEPSTFKVTRCSRRQAVAIGMVSFIHGANLTTKP